MVTRENARRTDEGRNEVLGLVSIALPGPWWWYTEDLSDSNASGAIFRCFEEGNDQEIAYLLIADISDDPDEPDIALLKQEDIANLDKFLEQAIRQLMASDGRRMTKWMSSQLNETAARKGLITAYIAEDQGRERQYIDVRIGVRGRKVVVAGCFDVKRADDLAVPIFTALRDAATLDATVN